MKRMAVPAALMSMVSGMLVRASTMTDVSSQSLRLSGSSLLPASAQMMSALFDMLFDGGKVMLACSSAGGWMVYVVILR